MEIIESRVSLFFLLQDHQAFLICSTYCWQSQVAAKRRRLWLSVLLNLDEGKVSVTISISNRYRQSSSKLEFNT